MASRISSPCCLVLPCAALCYNVLPRAPTVQYLYVGILQNRFHPQNGLQTLGIMSTAAGRKFDTFLLAAFPGYFSLHCNLFRRSQSKLHQFTPRPLPARARNVSKLSSCRSEKPLAPSFGRECTMSMLFMYRRIWLIKVDC